VHTYDDGRIVFEVNNDTNLFCGGSYPGAYTITPDKAGKAGVLATLMAAFLSGRRIQADWTGPGNNCDGALNMPMPNSVLVIYP
jgi:hypothetical protein